MTTNYFKNDYVEIRVQDEIIFMKCLNDIDLPKAKKIAEERLKIHNGNSMPVIVFGYKSRCFSREALKYLSKDDGIRHISVGALVVDNPVHRFIANFFLTIDKPEVKTKVFNTESEAVAWCKKQKYTDKK
ncbi:MAG: hypothetical protein ACK4ND_10265 [Cytophagaceae bacterium]